MSVWMILAVLVLIGLAIPATRQTVGCGCLGLVGFFLVPPLLARKDGRLGAIHIFAAGMR